MSYSGYGYGGYGYGGYGHGPPKPDQGPPSAVGVWVAARPAPGGVTFTANNLGFGDTDLTSVTVSWHACNIGAQAPQFR